MCEHSLAIAQGLPSSHVWVPRRDTAPTLLAPRVGGEDLLVVAQLDQSPGLTAAAALLPFPTAALHSAVLQPESLLHLPRFTAWGPLGGNLEILFCI